MIASVGTQFVMWHANNAKTITLQRAMTEKTHSPVQYQNVGINHSDIP